MHQVFRGLLQSQYCGIDCRKKLSVSWGFMVLLNTDEMLFGTC